jgi:hypothetical protein
MRTIIAPSFTPFIGVEELQVLIVLCLIGAWICVGFMPLSVLSGRFGGNLLTKERKPLSLFPFGLHQHGGI